MFLTTSVPYAELETVDEMVVVAHAYALDVPIQGMITQAAMQILGAFPVRLLAIPQDQLDVLTTVNISKRSWNKKKLTVEWWM